VPNFGFTRTSNVPPKPRDVHERNVVYAQYAIGAGLIVFGALLFVIYHWAGIFSVSDTSSTMSTLGYVATAIIGAGVAVLPVGAAGAASARILQGAQALARPPVATTGDATNSAVAANANGFTVKGTVNPSGQATRYFFEYGTDMSYGSASPPSQLSASTSDQAVTAELPAPAVAGTPYHFRVVAYNEFGSSSGADAVTP
jgi:hypothetical protein